MRQPGWEKRFFEWIENSKGRPFRYGDFDCALFVCDTIEILTGKNPREIIADLYRSEDEAEAVIGKYETLEAIAAIVAGKCNFESIPVLFAQRGDIVLAEIRASQWLGVCVGLRIALPAKEKGLAYIDIQSKVLKKAWRI